jgi:tRNA 2-thiouridine synthesizing protein A
MIRTAFGFCDPHPWRKQPSTCAASNVRSRCRERKALAGMRPGDILLVACTDPLAGIDIPNLLRETGDILEDTRNEARVMTFRIRKS